MNNLTLSKEDKIILVLGISELLSDDDDESESGIGPTEPEICKVVRRKRRWHVRPTFQEKQKGHFALLYKDLRNNDDDLFFKHLRMSPSCFDSLLEIIQHRITKKFVIRKPISPAERLAITLQYLAHGDSMTETSLDYRQGFSTVSGIISEVCEVIWELLNPMVFPELDEELLKNVAEDFERQWNFPNVVMAIDGKHIAIQKPSNAVSTFFNYKKHHSIVLLGTCDANYMFLYVDIGAGGRESDGGIFKNSSLGISLYSNNLPLPPPRDLSSTTKNIPYFVLGDAAFQLRTFLLRPYATEVEDDHRIFNYRLSRARRVIENAFGILVSRFRIFKSPIIASLKTTENITKACVCLHNWLIMNNVRHIPENQSIRAGAFREFNMNSHNNSRAAANLRDKISHYFMNEGQISWQYNR